MSDFVPTTPPNTPERIKEIDAWMAGEAQAATDALVKTLQESLEEMRALRKKMFTEGWPS